MPNARNRASPARPTTPRRGRRRRGRAPAAPRQPPRRARPPGRAPAAPRRTGPLLDAGQGASHAERHNGQARAGPTTAHRIEHGRRADHGPLLDDGQGASHAERHNGQARAWPTTGPARPSTPTAGSASTMPARADHTPSTGSASKAATPTTAAKAEHRQLPRQPPARPPRRAQPPDRARLPGRCMPGPGHRQLPDASPGNRAARRRWPAR
jgi:hypothetical protein